MRRSHSCQPSFTRVNRPRRHAFRCGAGDPRRRPHRHHDLVRVDVGSPPGRPRRGLLGMAFARSSTRAASPECLAGLLPAGIDPGVPGCQGGQPLSIRRGRPSDDLSFHRRRGIIEIRRVEHRLGQGWTCAISASADRTRRLCAEEHPRRPPHQGRRGCVAMVAGERRVRPHRAR